MLSSSTFLRRNGSFLRALEVTNRSRRVTIVGKIEILNPKTQMSPTVESEPRRGADGPSGSRGRTAGDWNAHKVGGVLETFFILFFLIMSTFSDLALINDPSYKAIVEDFANNEENLNTAFRHAW